MKNIKVLGSGCANCKTTLGLIEDAAKEKGIEVELSKIEDMQDIISYGVLSTPGVVVDGTLVHSGGLPTKENIDSWLSGNKDGNCSDCSEKDSNNCCG